MIYGDDTVVPSLPDAFALEPDAPQRGSGHQIKEGLDNLGDKIIDGIDRLLGKVTGAAVGLLGGGMAIGASYTTGRAEDPGFEPLASATPVTLGKSQKIEAPSQEKAIEKSVSPYDVDMRDVGQFVPDTPRVAVAMDTRNESMGRSA